MLFRERQQIAICVVAAAMVGGFVLLRYLPLRKRIEIVEQAKVERMLAVTKGQAQSKQLPVLEEQLLKLQHSIGNYQARIPQQRELGVFLRKIADLMNEHNLKEQVIAPAEEVEAEELNCIPVNIQCKGKLAQVFEFCRQLQALDRLVRVEQVKLTNDTDFGGEVTMETRTVVYYGAKISQEQGKVGT